MDFWVFVAAAGAGCLAKHLQRSSINNYGLSKLSYGISSSGDQELHDYPNCSVAQGKKLEKDASPYRENTSHEETYDMPLSNCLSAADWASSSRLDDQESATDLQECHDASFEAGVPPVFSSKQPEIEDCNRMSLASNDLDNTEVSSAMPLGGETATFHGYPKHRHVLRSRYLHRQCPKPQSSLESCFMAQLYNHNAEMGNFSLSHFMPPTSPGFRPLLVTNGSSIISRFTDPSLEKSRTKAKKSRQIVSEEGRVVLGVPPLPNCGSSKVNKHMHNRTVKEKSIDSSSRIITEKKIHPRNGTPGGTKLLCIGISLGIIFSILANKKEVDKLKELLKQTENLVQDLQDELELTDSLTVKELASENYESLDAHNNYLHGTACSIFSTEHSMENPIKSDGKDARIERACMNPDSMTRIEAELEAELERLEMDIRVSNLDRRLSDAELDPVFHKDFAQGEFIAERDYRLKDENQKRYSSSSSTIHSVNYVVSPWELSLRLHELIQRRLEDRIEELELALQNSQRKVQLLEPSTSQRQSRSPMIKDHAPSPEPLVMNLSGEALAAYNEACEELVKFEPEEDQSPSSLYDLECSGTGQGRVQEIYNMYLTGYESSDTEADDENERLLIKQIIERTKKDSSVIMNALLSIPKDRE
ncbi:hypothetical protein SAY86_006141 [Trapa natans]|uniref:Uncharacterized protein n=1 Tax=Trapa natans TaxID=22666 RepID=A0AAN7L978_TRANT|nr:hypothetical protein SAY86_006141 [Trapa natans]